MQACEGNPNCPTDQSRGKTVLVLIEERFGYQVIEIVPDVIRAVGDRRGDFWEVEIEQRGVNWKAGPLSIRQLDDIKQIV